jgi:hypothetical protein
MIPYGNIHSLKGILSTEKISIGSDLIWGFETEDLKLRI